MTEGDLIELGFTKQIQDTCCDPQPYTFYKTVGNASPFITPDSTTIDDDNWPVENYAISFVHCKPNTLFTITSYFYRVANFTKNHSCQLLIYLIILNDKDIKIQWYGIRD